MISFSALGRGMAQILAANSTTILTGAGMVGVVGTSYLTAKAAFDAAEKISNETDKRVGIEMDKIKVTERTPEKIEELIKLVHMTKKDKAKLVWIDFVPAVAAGGLTLACIFLSHRISTKQLAAMTAAYALSEKSLQEYKDKVTEKLGLTKAEKISTEVAQDRVNENPPPQNLFIMEGADVLAQDTISGRYFRTTMEKVRKAEAKANTDILNFNEASVSSFYDALGLEPTSISDHIGWNVNNLCEVEIDTAIYQDKPVMVINFRNRPMPDYGRNY